MTTEKKIIEDLIEEGKDRLWGSMEGRFEFSLRKCESPIERVFLAAVFSYHMTGLNDGAFYGCPVWYEFLDLSEISDNNVHCRSIRVIPQAKLEIQNRLHDDKSYRVDFLIIAARPTTELMKFDTSRWVIECDGHDYHEKTKEQAKRDKSRDRHMMMAGITVQRFTGSEIWADPFSCAVQAFNPILEWVWGVR